MRRAKNQNLSRRFKKGRRENGKSPLPPFLKGGGKREELRQKLATKAEIVGKTGKDLSPKNRDEKLLWYFTSVVFFMLIVVAPSFSALRPEIGVRALGMAGAFTANEADPTAALWNPAGLAKLQYKHITYDISQGAISVVYPINRIGTLGINILDLDEKRFLRENPNNPIGVFKIGYNQIMLSYARGIGQRFTFGANIGYNRAPYRRSLWKPNYDFGIITTLSPDLSLGARITDIARTDIPNSRGETLKTFRQNVIVGAAWKPLKYLHLNGDFDTAKWKIKFGTETEIKGISPRAGLITNLNQSDGFFGWTLGLSVNWLNKQVNYAYINDTDIAYKHFLSLGFQFGSLRGGLPSSIPEPIPHPAENDRELLDSIATFELQPTSAQEARPLIPPAPKPTKPMLDKDRTPRAEDPILPEISVPPITPSSLPPPQDDNFEKPDKNRLVDSMDNCVGFLLEKLVQKHNLELPFVLAVMRIESNFNPNAISSSGAVGLMQLMPDTARGLGLKVPAYKNIKKPNKNPRLDERFDPKKNITAGMVYLRQMVDKYDENYVLALSAYNAGPGRVIKTVPEIRQTERHVGKVLNYYYEYKNSPQLMQEVLKRLDAI